MSEQVKVEVGQVYIDTGDSDKTRRRLTECGDVEVQDSNGGWMSSAVSEENFRHYVAKGEFIPEPPDHRDAVVAAARKLEKYAALESCAYVVSLEEMGVLRTALSALDRAGGGK